MRCYRIDEAALVGIPLTTTEAGLHIEVGDARVVLDASLDRSVRAARESVLETIRECLKTRKILGHSATEEEMEELKDMEEQAQAELFLIHTDVEQGKIVRERKPSPRALVLVETPPGIGGRIRFKSNSFDEVFEERSGRVRRVYREEFPPPGIEVLAVGRDEQHGGRVLLLVMLPGSSFRIERTGELEDLPTTLTVSWKGQKGVGGVQPLEVWSPARGRSVGEPAASQIVQS